VLETMLLIRILTSDFSFFARSFDPFLSLTYRLKTVTASSGTGVVETMVGLTNVP
jgi:hypothetical protein